MLQLTGPRWTVLPSSTLGSTIDAWPPAVKGTAGSVASAALQLSTKSVGQTRESVTHLFFDESKHPDAGFCVGAFVCAPPEIDAVIREVLVSHGFDPSVHEFKSSTRMDRVPAMRSVRVDLAAALHEVDCAVAITLAKTPIELGSAALVHLASLLNHTAFNEGKHEAFLDEGLFRSRHNAHSVARTIDGLDRCTLHLEQSSLHVPGIQLADLAAHYCATMLLEALGLVTKTVHDEEDPESEYSLGFELGAALRYSFFAEAPVTHDFDDPDAARYRVSPEALYIDASIAEPLRSVATERFGFVWMGCIH